MDELELIQQQQELIRLLASERRALYERIERRMPHARRVRVACDMGPLGFAFMHIGHPTFVGLGSLCLGLAACLLLSIPIDRFFQESE